MKHHISKRTTPPDDPNRVVVLTEHIEPRPLGGYRVRAIPYTPYVKGRITKQRNIANRVLQHIRDLDERAPRPSVITLGGYIGDTEMPVSIPLVGTDTARIAARIKEWSRKPARNVPDEVTYQTLVARLHARNDAGELIDEAGPIACRIAWQVAKRFTRSRLAYTKTQAHAIAMHVLARATGNANDGFHGPDIKHCSYSSAMVTISTLEEMTLAALLPLRIRSGELPKYIATRQTCYAYFPNGRGGGVSPVITAAYRAARNALVKELEHVGIGLLPAHELNNLHGAPFTIYERPERETRAIMAKAIAKKVYLLREYIVRHWHKSPSRKARQGLQGDLRTLQMATRAMLELPVKYGKRSALRARVNLLEARLDVELSRSIARRNAAQRQRDYRARIHHKLGIG